MLRRWKPEEFIYLDNLSLDDVVDIAIIVYIEYAASKGRPVYKNLFFNKKDNSGKKYRRIFLKMILNLFQIFHITITNTTFHEKQYLNRIHLMMLFLDFMSAFGDYSLQRFKNLFYIPQLQSGFAMEIFYSWCEVEYGSVTNYVKKILSQEEQKVMEEKEVLFYTKTIQKLRDVVKRKSSKELVLDFNKR